MCRRLSDIFLLVVLFVVSPHTQSNDLFITFSTSWRPQKFWDEFKYARVLIPTSKIAFLFFDRFLYRRNFEFYSARIPLCVCMLCECIQQRYRRMCAVAFLCFAWTMTNSSNTFYSSFSMGPALLPCHRHEVFEALTTLNGEQSCV